MFKTKKQNILPVQRLNRYGATEKVLLFSNTYRWGVVDHVWIEENKKHSKGPIGKRFRYRIKFADGSKPMECSEEELLPYVPKWQWKMLAFLGIVTT